MWSAELMQTSVFVEQVGPQLLPDPQQILTACFPPPWLQEDIRSHIVICIAMPAGSPSVHALQLTIYKPNCYLATVCKSQLMRLSFWDCMSGDLFLSFSARCGRKNSWDINSSQGCADRYDTLLAPTITTISFRVISPFFHRISTSMNIFSGHEPKTYIYIYSLIASAAVIFLHGSCILSLLWSNPQSLIY